MNMAQESEIKVSSKYQKEQEVKSLSKYHKGSEIKVSSKYQKEQEVKPASKYQDGDILKSLDSLVDETLQVYEYNGQEDAALKEICDTVAMMLTQMKTAISISAVLVGPNNTVKRAILGQNGQVMIVYRDDEVEYRSLVDFRPSILIEIFNDIFPKLKEAAIEYRKHLEERLTLYRTTNKSFKKIEKVLEDSKQITMEDLTDNEDKYSR